MDPKENQAALFEGLAALDRDLPEVLVERRNASIRFREFQKRGILGAGYDRSSPRSHRDRLAGVPQWSAEGSSHPRASASDEKRVGPVLVGEVARIRQACQDVI